jgi:hypothetical protein
VTATVHPGVAGGLVTLHDRLEPVDVIRSCYEVVNVRLGCVRRRVYIHVSPQASRVVSKTVDLRIWWDVLKNREHGTQVGFEAGERLCSPDQNGSCNSVVLLLERSIFDAPATACRRDSPHPKLDTWVRLVLAISTHARRIAIENW